MGAQRYRSGPGLMDLAVLLPSGKWMRMANGLQLLPEQVATWHELSAASVVEESPHVVRVDAREIDKIVALGATYTEDAERLTFSSLVEVIEQGAYQRGQSNAYQAGYKAALEEVAVTSPSASTPKKVPPSEQKIKLLVAFEKHTAGLTMREAAEAAGLIGVPNYSSRFGSDLLKNDWVSGPAGLSRNGSKVLQITQAGRWELARMRRTP